MTADGDERIVSNLVYLRLVLSGALVGIALAQVLGLSSGLAYECLAGALGAAAVMAAKRKHYI